MIIHLTNTPTCVKQTVFKYTSQVKYLKYVKTAPNPCYQFNMNMKICSPNNTRLYQYINLEDTGLLTVLICDLSAIFIVFNMINNIKK